MKANGFLASGWSSLPVRKDRVSVGRKPTVTSVARALVWSASSRVEGRRDGAQVALSAKVEENTGCGQLPNRDDLTMVDVRRWMEMQKGITGTPISTAFKPSPPPTP
jgi:hypothetical protein